MEDKQKLKLSSLAVDSASDFDEANAGDVFIFGLKEPFVTRTPLDDEEEGCKRKYVKDGVYLVKDKSILIRLEDAKNVRTPKHCDVMVSYHGHKWIVAKNDVSEDKLHLLKDDAKREESSPFYKFEIEALNDFDMKSCTNHLRKSGFNFKLNDDLYIPTAGQLAAMYLYRKDLNKALEMTGGTIIKEEGYWSSSEYFERCNWGVSFCSGCVYGWLCKSYNGYVRPCAAFKL